MTSDWPAYLDDFHARRPGLTEQVLSRCTAGELTPYAWVLRAVAGRGRRVLDLACGSGAVTGVLHAEPSPAGIDPTPLVVGVDRSLAELAVARSAHDAHVLCADATALPFGDGCFDAIVCSMSLMVVQPLATVLAECARVVRPGAMLAATVASPMPLRPSDVLVLGPLTARLRTPPQFPGGGELVGLSESLAGAGFDVMEDARERFAFRVRDRDDAELLLSALYLPDAPDERWQSALAWLSERAESRPDGVEVAIPIRRILALRR